MFEPVKLKFLDGTVVQLMYSIGAGVRIKNALGVSIFENFREMLNEERFAACIRAMAVKWDDTEGWWVHDPDAPSEAQILNKCHFQVAGNALTAAWDAAKANPSTPEIPPPATVQ